MDLPLDSFQEEAQVRHVSLRKLYSVLTITPTIVQEIQHYIMTSWIIPK